MNEFMGEWAVTITVAVLLAAILEALIPEGNIKKYVNFIIGLLITIIILFPIISLFNNNSNAAKDINDFFNYDNENTYEINENEDISYKDYIFEVYTRSLENNND